MATSPATTSAKPSADTKPPAVKKAAGKATWQSRAVVRLIEAGCVAECPVCGERVKYRARHRDQQVICNVYDKGRWQRVEQYHLDCYTAADCPHGPVE
ncbi:MAG: hypothetical protein R2761_22960 [Acidimicrobiales bacterium]